MSEQAYFNQITSESKFEARFSAEDGKPFSQLGDAAASGWDRRHLLACRSDSHLQQNFSTEIQNFIDGPKEDVSSYSEYRLVRICGFSLCQIWSTLSTFNQHSQSLRQGLEEDQIRTIEDESNSTNKRARRNTAKESFVNSSAIQINSSSPAMEQSSQGSSSIGFVDQDSHSTSVLLEDQTVRLAVCIIRHIVLFSRPQDNPPPEHVVQVRDTKSMLRARTSIYDREVTAIDDGGLYLRDNEIGSTQVLKPHVALIEAKRQFQRIENGRPIISDPCLAQMTCEALAARLSDRDRDANTL
ncbi:Purine-cytosine permease FCY22 [Fusarium bulbicola]|nr:Purine-cytosine permease FCY22 [Fusarium bulbicola]